MRRITLAVVGTVAALVLLFSYRTSTGGSGGSAGTAPPGIVGPTGTGADPAATSAATVSVNGSVEDNGFGPVQVRIAVSAGRIVDVSTVSLPQDGHSQRINSYAVPLLRQEVLDAQSARVDTVTGATATSDAYLQSVQAALDAAHLGSGS
ncbi:FMN-binding protein [Asanoa iriomotensis]|uniref:FMN-binding protein n=1 Tax=Asanoa iriomotensis TaxID=234613 RepID=A0ABQ4CCM2_9ACTN|nr:FMN-binding protein [Asanoa iriomotensis]GIF60518.1 FMN-binding protein [Asanoa iriomotensis]